jgi:hypothetical protein
MNSVRFAAGILMAAFVSQASPAWADEAVQHGSAPVGNERGSPVASNGRGPGYGLSGCVSAARPCAVPAATSDVAWRANEAARSLIERCVQAQSRAARNNLSASVRRTIAFNCGAR